MRTELITTSWQGGIAMSNVPSSSEGYSERNDQLFTRSDSRRSKSKTRVDQALLDRLMDSGFSWKEAVTLFNYREQLYETGEMRQRMAEDYRMLFARWMYEQGFVNEEIHQEEREQD
ncbi:MAG TPA: hypothetical protein VL461_14640 [Dictyobacter sp.]|jgi:hypothetical protein|nr:hypothetical protein [Dictyobacter sp.]